MSSPNFEKHNQVYENSGLTMKQYCQKHQISYTGLRNFRYQFNLKNRAIDKSNPNPTPESKFKKFNVGLKLQISIDSNGSLSIHGIMPEHLPKIIRGLNALS